VYQQKVRPGLLISVIHKKRGSGLPILPNFSITGYRNTTSTSQSAGCSVICSPQGCKRALQLKSDLGISQDLSTEDNTSNTAFSLFVCLVVARSCLCLMHSPLRTCADTLDSQHKRSPGRNDAHAHNELRVLVNLQACNTAGTID